MIRTPTTVRRSAPPIAETAAEHDPYGDASVAGARERAREALLVACDGWRERRRCTAPDGTRIRNPHPECLAAQYRHEVILLEHGIAR
jgi:hypothetical protein